LLEVGKGGIKMKASEAAEQAPSPQQGDGPVRLKPGGGPATAGPNNVVRPIRGQGMVMMRPGHVEAANSNTEMLAHILSDQLGRTVIDKTGLTSNYDYTLEWTPDNAPPPMPGGADGGAMHHENSGEATGPSLFTAVQEQLGLKLETSKGATDVIVIDHIDLPSEN